MTLRTAKEDVLIGGLDDDISAEWVLTSIWDDVTPDNRRPLGIGLIAELLVENCVVAGDIDKDGFHQWGCSVGESIERITREWLCEWGDELPTPGAIVWLVNTELGNQVARRALAREGESD